MPTLLNKLAFAEAPETELLEMCPLCLSKDSEFLFWNVDRLHHLPGKFGVIRCDGCGLARLSPRPKKENLGFYYPEDDYYSYQSNGNGDQASTRKLIGSLRDKIRDSVLDSMGYANSKLNPWQKLFQPVFAKFLKKQSTFGWGERMPSFVPGGKALEVGCGSGSALNFLKRLGWKVNGIEMSLKASLAAKELYDIDVFCGRIADAPYERGSFDYVHLSHVLEHFTDPIEDLKDIIAFLKPGGIIYIEVPNIESFGQHKSGVYWMHWDSPRHLFGFEPSTLKKTVQQAGLKIKRMKTLVGNSWDSDEAYRLEESSGQKLGDGTTLTQGQKLGHLRSRIVNRVSFLIDKDCGDVVCCWAVKE